MYTEYLTVRVCHSFEEGVRGIASGPDGVCAAVFEPPSPRTLIHGSRVSIQPIEQVGGGWTCMCKYNVLTLTCSIYMYL